MTLEAQNKWTSCTQVTQHKVYYDDLLIEAYTLPVPESPLIDPFVKYTTMSVGETQTYSIGPDYRVFLLTGNPGASVLEDGHTISFTPTTTGGNGIKFKACDIATYLCTEAWWDIQVTSR